MRHADNETRYQDGLSLGHRHKKGRASIGEEAMWRVPRYDGRKRACGAAGAYNASWASSFEVELQMFHQGRRFGQAPHPLRRGQLQGGWDVGARRPRSASGRRREARQLV
jgi:hypothetical protein